MYRIFCLYICFFLTQKTAYELRISDWSSDVCSSDLVEFVAGGFYTNEKNLYRTIITVNTAAGVPLTAPFDLLFVANTISNYEEEAAFGNLTFYLSDKLDITGGIRYAHNSQFAQTGGPGAISFYAPRATGNFTFNENVTTYLARKSDVKGKSVAVRVNRGGSH